MDKFGRNYSLQVWPKTPYDTASTVGPSALFAPPALTIPYPFTLEFSITRAAVGAMNEAKLSIYNIGKDKRNFLRYNWSDKLSFQQVQLNAGYGNNTPVVFVGNIIQAYSARDGVNYVTSIEAKDMAFGQINATFNQTFSAQTEYQTVIETLVNAIPGISMGVIGSFAGKITRPLSLSGNPADLLSELTRGSFFVDLGKGHVLGLNEYIETPLMKIISPASGLLNTPYVEQNNIRVEMLFEPTMHVGEAVRLQGVSDTSVNGVYKIWSVRHRGTISGATCGQAVTEVELRTGQGSKLTAVAA